MPRTNSPLRYPGGKSQLLPFVRELISYINPSPVCYCEPFCGGAGIAISLLLNDEVKDIIINDADFGIFSFWKAIVEETDRFVNMINSTPITIDEWNKQKRILLDSTNTSIIKGQYSFELGFATFFLNRTNVSGIIKGGVIGGLAQTGKNKLDCRFKKQVLIKKIQAIAKKKDHITITNFDGRELIKMVSSSENADKTFMFVDPPYVKQGKNLYLNALTIDDHNELYGEIKTADQLRWIVTYDDCVEIRNMYNSQDLRRYFIRYSANNRRKASELIAFSKHFAQFESSIVEMEKIDILASQNNVID